MAVGDSDGPGCQEEEEEDQKTRKYTGFLDNGGVPNGDVQEKLHGQVRVVGPDIKDS